MHKNLEKKFCAIGPRSICSGACAIIFTNCQTYVYDPVTMNEVTTGNAVRAPYYWER